MADSVAELLVEGQKRQKHGRWREASELFRTAATRDPSDPRPRLLFAVTLQYLGRLNEAIEIYESLRQTAVSCLALCQLSKLSPTRISAEDERELLKGSNECAAADRSRVFYAIGQVRDSQGRFDEAFEAFAAGAAAERLGLDPEQAQNADYEQIRYAKSVFTSEFLTFHSGAGHRAKPIFIVGMPRSGSTLLAQILSAHSQVRDLGESPALATVTRGKYPYPLFGPKAPDHFRRLAKSYLNGVTGRTVDKALANYRAVGIIHLMFPDAVILHSSRDPADTCLSNFFELFDSGNEQSYDLADIGRLYVRYREMMDHWKAVLPGRVIDVEYEALVADPDDQARWLLEACKLPWDSRCLRFHESKRPVLTASVAQVRRPIFTSSVGRWRAYRKHLGPLFEALGPYAPSDR